MGDHVFFCYAREDQGFALKLAGNLKARGVPVWVDQWDIPPTADWDRSIDRALADCARFLIVLSPASVERREVRGELRTALDDNKPIVPVLYQPCLVPRQLKVIQLIDCTSRGADDEAVLGEVLRAVGVAAQPPTARAAVDKTVAADRGEPAREAPPATGQPAEERTARTAEADTVRERVEPARAAPFPTVPPARAERARREAHPVIRAAPVPTWRRPLVWAVGALVVFIVAVVLWPVVRGNATPAAPASIAILGHGAADVTSAVFSPDGRQVVTAGSGDSTARVWDAASGRDVAVLRGHTEEVTHAEFSPDGRQVVTSGDRTARVWDAASGRDVAVLRGHTGGVTHAGFSPDGRQVVTASADETARVWEAASGREVAVLRGHTDWVRHAGFSPDGRQVMTASGDGTARVWDAASGREVAVLRGHTDGVRRAGFSPDGRQVVTASRDSTARVWDAASGREVAVLRGHRDGVWLAEFSPDGRQVVTVSLDGTARVWRVGAGDFAP